MSATTTTKPTILIVPGSFSAASHYDTLINSLQALSYPAVVSDLPSASRLPPAPAASMADDAAHFHGIAESLADEGRDIVILTHSYGGVPGTEAAKGLAKADREAEGKKGGVVRLVYLTSIVPPLGGSLISTMGEVSEAITINGDYMTLDPAVIGPATFSDLSPDLALEWGKKLTTHSLPSFSGKITYPAYRHIPTSFIFCERDLIISPDLQRATISFLESERGGEGSVSVVKLDTGHCPNVSVPEETAAGIAKAIEGVSV
ncbi:hypothetical protein VE01_09000 [Pseudogymnoascus verrucosus]|uniref:AB hydrolase-1 domain-containing protein n=1 Tax=Pseudogymnoascus verrucosus TaxID=342668 RepID=A0A1B8GB26_9PEZI|nr:uncharacterized protein VE01_09000 [Pseudogymnoascus verrucosus]OBT93045.1 hypothetical protein VE01_09000 [Pseudogymnoascus verrucosus]